MYNLPPRISNRLDSAQFANLHTFFVAARHLSFLHAADELCITASAVSHRIKRLEQTLGMELFQRLTRKIVLTHEGERIFKVLQQTMGELAEALQPCSEESMEGRITIYSRPSIAQCWLLPRLTDFAQQYPGISIDLRVGNDNIDFRSQNIDLAIDYARGEFPNLVSHRLMDECITPVCSPAYAKQFDLINHPENLIHCRLLHDARAWNHAAYDAEWALWIKTNAPHITLPSRCFSFDRSDLCLSAAQHGSGIAMGRRRLAQTAIEHGALIRPFHDLEPPSPYAYYALHPHGQPLPARTRVFLDWLHTQCAAATDT